MWRERGERESGREGGETESGNVQKLRQEVSQLTTLRDGQ